MGSLHSIGKLPPPKPQALPEVRTKLYPGEDEFFKQNPGTTGMAAEDNRVILNPYSGRSTQERDSVTTNEQARILMRTGKAPKPDFDITDEQKKAFKGTAYEKDEQAMRETLAARILSGDPSAGKPTRQQSEFVSKYLAPKFGRK